MKKYILLIALICSASLLITKSTTIAKMSNQKIDSFLAFDSKLEKKEIISNILFWVNNNYNVQTDFSNNNPKAFLDENDLSVIEKTYANAQIISNYAFPIRYNVFHDSAKESYILTFEVYLDKMWALYDPFNAKLFEVNNSFIEAVQLEIVDNELLGEYKSIYKQQIQFESNKLILINQKNIRKYY